jgi:hypothetical protein
MTSTYAPLRQVIVEEGTDAMNFVPHSIRSEHVSRAISANRKVTTIRPLGGSSIQAGGQLIFAYPFGTSAGYIKPSSCYLRFDLSVSGMSSTGTWGFAGAMGNSTSLINQFNCSMGGVTVENILYVNKLVSNIINPYMTSASYGNALSLLTGLSGGGEANIKAVSWTGSQASTANYNILPFQQFTAGANPKLLMPFNFSGLLSGGDSISAIPLFALNSPLTLQLLMSSVNDAFWASEPTITNYTMNNIELVFEQINPPIDFIESMKSQMASNIYTIPITTVMSAVTQGGATVSYNQSLNTSCLKGYCAGYLPSHNQNTSVANSKQFSSPTGAMSNQDVTNPFFNRILLLDSEQTDFFPDRCQDSVTKVAENMRMVAGSVLGDPDYTLPFQSIGQWNAYNTYLGSYFSTFFNIAPFSNESSLCFNGKPVNIANFIANVGSSQTATSNSDSVYLYAWVQQLIAIAGDGSVTIVK